MNINLVRDAFTDFAYKQLESERENERSRIVDKDGWSMTTNVDYKSLPQEATVNVLHNIDITTSKKVYIVDL